MKSTKTSIFILSNTEHALFAQRCASFSFIGLSQWCWYEFSHLAWKPKVAFDYFQSISFIPTFKILLIFDNSFTEIHFYFLFPVLKVIFIWCHYQTFIGSTVSSSGVCIQQFIIHPSSETFQDQILVMLHSYLVFLRDFF